MQHRGGTHRILYCSESQLSRFDGFFGVPLMSFSDAQVEAISHYFGMQLPIFTISKLPEFTSTTSCIAIILGTVVVVILSSGSQTTGLIF